MSHFFFFTKQQLEKIIVSYCLLLCLIFFASFAFAAESKGAGSFAIDEEASVRALEHSLVQAGSLLLAKGKLDVQVGLGFSRTENDVLLTNNGTVIGQTKNTFTEVNVPFSIRVGLPYDAQIDFSIPLLYVDEQFIDTLGANSPVDTSREGSGIGDIRLTLSKTLSREKGWKPDVIGFFSWDADNGKRSDNNVFLSAGFNEFSAGLTLTKSQDPLVFSASISGQVTAEKNNIQPGDQLNLSLAAFLAASPKTSLSFSLDQTFADKTEVNDREVVNSERTVSLLNLGVSSAVSSKTFLSLSAGAGLTDDSPDYVVNISFSTRFNLP